MKKEGHAITPRHPSTGSGNGEDERPASVTEEIAKMRVLVDEAYEQRAPITSVARGMDALARLMKVEYEISQKSAESVTDALTRTVEQVADQLGLTKFTE